MSRHFRFFAIAFISLAQLHATSWQAEGLWHQTTLRHQGDGLSWYYGQESTQTYDTGQVHSGSLIRHGIIAGPDTELSFWYWLQSENQPGKDLATIEISDDDGITWTVLMELPDTGGSWQQQTIALPDSAGESVTLRLYFNTVDAIWNQYEGWYVDELHLSGDPAPLTVDALAVSHEEIQLSWSAFPGADSFVVSRSEDGNTWETIISLDVDARGYLDTDLEPSTVYFYRVAAQ
jgi:hypothetical protein